MQIDNLMCRPQIGRRLKKKCKSPMDIQLFQMSLLCGVYNVVNILCLYITGGFDICKCLQLGEFSEQHAVGVSVTVP